MEAIPRSPKSVDVCAHVWPEVMQLIEQQKAEHQLTPSGAVHDAMRRYFRLPEIKEPAAETEASEEATTAPEKPPEQARSPALHPDTEVALRLLRMAMEAHPEDQAAVTGLVVAPPTADG
jgi:hypothetical protein